MPVEIGPQRRDPIRRPLQVTEHICCPTCASRRVKFYGNPGGVPGPVRYYRCLVCSPDGGVEPTRFKVIRIRPSWAKRDDDD